MLLLQDWTTVMLFLQKSKIGKLQVIQKSAARLLTKTRKTVHITPVLVALH